jgi:hypothetical protein
MKENDIPVKIRAALEQAVNGQAWGLFEGLQNDGVVLKLTYDGVNMNIERVGIVCPSFVALKETKVSYSEPALPEPVIDDPPNVCEETQTRRKGRHGSRNETE